MKTVVEKERRWLIRAWIPSWYDHEKKSMYISQFYTEDGWRYRMESDGETGENKYYRLKKINIGKGINYEMALEEVTGEEYSKVFKETKNAPFISKTRHIFEHDGRTLELDIFHNVALAILEIEGVEMTDKINLPEWIQPYVLMEITGDDKFSNSKLAIPVDESYHEF